MNQYDDIDDEKPRGLSLAEKFDLVTAGGVMAFEQSDARIHRLRGFRASIFNNCRSCK